MRSIAYRGRSWGPLFMEATKQFEQGFGECAVMIVAELYGDSFCF